MVQGSQKKLNTIKECKDYEVMFIKKLKKVVIIMNNLIENKTKQIRTKTEKSVLAYQRQVKTFSGMSEINKTYYNKFSAQCNNFTQYKPDIGVICEAYDDITALTPNDIEEYLNANEVKNKATYNNKKAHIHSFLKYVARITLKQDKKCPRSYWYI